MKTVIVGSTNPVKLAVTKKAFATAFPEEEFIFTPFDSRSLVPDQPFGDSETKTGATNRTLASKAEFPEADFFVGLEGGLEEVEGDMWAFAWMCIQNKSGKTGFGRTGSFLLPEELAVLIKDGAELGTASDKVFGKINSKQKGGSVKILTAGAIDRTEFYYQAMIFALIPFLHPDLY